MNEIQKIDFISRPRESFLDSTDYISNHFRQFSIINEICSEFETFDSFVTAFVTFAYFRINGLSSRLSIEIPYEASIATLLYNEDDNFFIEILNRFKLICINYPSLNKAAD